VESWSRGAPIHLASGLSMNVVGADERRLILGSDRLRPTADVFRVTSSALTLFLVRHTFRSCPANQERLLVWRLFAS